jgi:phosphotransferase system  glucose/maltose/N-acetylglucosamine-specific IIC component
LPLESYGVAPGTKFLVALEDELNTKGTPENSRFKVRTLEPLEAGSGVYLPSGATIHGHVSRVEPAGVAGKAKIWLTFDEIQTKFGKLPIVAEVTSVPGDHSVKAESLQEGVIEGRSSTQHNAANAAAAGAALGAVKGVREKDKKEAAEGAAMGAITAYLMESGRGHEIDLPKGAKLELELARTLYLVKE